MTDITEARPVPDEARPPAGTHDHVHLGWALVLISVAQLMVVLDATIANIALPYIQNDLGISQANLQWVVTGYALAFGLVAAAQSGLAVGLSVGLLGLDVVGPVWLLSLVAVTDAVLGTALGLFVSAFAQTEFQAVQFMPAVVLPQILLCGLFVPRAALPDVLEAVSDVLPLSYAVDEMQHLTRTASTGEVWQDLAVVAAFALAGLALGAVTLPRRTP